jgi:DNA-binding NarL/FixJ family response regulator
MTVRRKVLLVDDSALVRAVVTHCLEARELVVATIEDPRDLAAALDREAPDLVLVDATFPGIDREELVRHLTPHAGRARFVMFSDKPEAEIAALAARVGAVGVVPKEAAGDTLGDRLEPFLAQS